MSDEEPWAPLPQTAVHSWYDEGWHAIGLMGEIYALPVHDQPGANWAGRGWAVVGYLNENGNRLLAALIAQAAEVKRLKEEVAQRAGAYTAIMEANEKLGKRVAQLERRARHLRDRMRQELAENVRLILSGAALRYDRDSLSKEVARLHLLRVLDMVQLARHNELIAELRATKHQLDEAQKEAGYWEAEARAMASENRRY
jgi:metal-dependent amidase/aminoacylase/carboxypeptidase family protein